VPIHLTTSFVFESSDHAAALFNLERAGHVYSRISNPTNAVFEQRMAALEGGIGAIAVASGQAALHLSIATLMGAGSHIVASTALYGGSQNLLHYTLRRFGIETTFVKPGDIDGWRAAVRPNTKLFFGETVGNPGLDVLDIPTVSAIAHEHGVPLLVDSTFTTPWLIKPFEHGADLVYHSATKFLSGHGTVIGGVVVDGGSFDWEGLGRQVHRDDAGLRGLPQHGVHRGKHRGRLPAARTPRGPARLRRLHEPAHRLADPAGHRDPAAAHGAAHAQHREGGGVPGRQPFVEPRGPPAAGEPPQPPLAQKLLPRGAGSVFSFDLKGTREQGKKFIETLKIFSHLANVGDCRSLVIHPASTTHFRMSDDALAGRHHQGTIRLSIGLEDPTT
jgi:O-acetylhomoserine (thiol)-lyase